MNIFRKKKLTKDTTTLAICIAFLPPLWAVLAPYLGIQTGSVALICAAVYVTNCNQVKDAVKISIGFLLGDVWGLLVTILSGYMPFSDNINLFILLMVFGALAVLISAIFDRWIFLPALLCGWAIGLTVFPFISNQEIGTCFIQIAVSMIVGVWYIGVILNKVQKYLLKI